MTSGEELHKEVIDVALLDPLTGLPNRVPLNAALEYLVGFEEGDFGVIVGDANGLKGINDSEGGHQAGDEYIVEIATTLSEGVRHNRETPDITGLVARVGGDEFVVLIRNVNTPEQLDGIMGRLKGQLAEKNLSVSLGYQLHEPGMTKEQLLHLADVYMQRHKRTEKLELIDEQQAEALLTIGRLALLNGIALRDIPGLVTAIEERDRERQQQPGLE